MGWLPKVNRHVDYVNSAGKLRPATVVAVSGTDLDLRVGHHGETYASVPIQDADNQTGVWRSGKAYTGGVVISGSILLLESGDVVLLESGNKLLLES